MKNQTKYNIILIILLAIVTSFLLVKKMSIKEGKIQDDVNKFKDYLETMRKLKSQAMSAGASNKPDEYD